jgi:menaquinone-dependent protoporphyrinogen IX oxidase
MKGVIVYASNYGATEQYAKWLGEALGFEAVPVGRGIELEGLDTVIFGTSVRVGKFGIAPWIKKNRAALGEKRLALFSTSGLPKESPELVKIYEASFDEATRSVLPYFPLDGRKKMAEMSWLDRNMIKLGSKMIGKKNPAEGARMLQDFDRVDKAAIEPILRLFRS